MTRTHIPVLAGELIALTEPRPGEVAVDCTFGGGGHARLIADCLGPAGTLIGIDRDPIAEERFAEISAEVPCHTRFIRADFVSGLSQLQQEGSAPTSCTSTSACPRCRSTPGCAVSPTRTTRRWTCAWTPTTSYGTGHRQHLGRAPARAPAARIRRGALRLPDRPRDRPHASTPGAELHPPARRGDQVGGPGSRPVRRRPSRPGARSRRCGSPSTTSLPSSTRRCRSPGTCCAPTAGSPRSLSTRSRIAA